VEPVPEVGDIVQPQLTVSPRLLEDVAGQRVLQLALVQIGPEQDRQQGTQTGAEQQQRRQPADRPLRCETQLMRIHAGRPARGRPLGLDGLGRLRRLMRVHHPRDSIAGVRQCA
jgi:hypothetical protein